jgi:hypothetical protein
MSKHHSCECYGVWCDFIRVGEGHIVRAMAQSPAGAWRRNSFGSLAIFAAIRRRESRDLAYFGTCSMVPAASQSSAHAPRLAGVCSAGRRYVAANRASLYLRRLGVVAAWEVSMVDLHETNNPEREPQIDTVGLFLAFAVAITAAAAIIAYQANDAMVANAPMSHVVAR